MKERLAVRFEVPDFLGSAPFPPMMLQTLIENSIKHGLEPKVAGGTITIRAHVEVATLHVDVCDDGVGIDLHADEGVGLANIRERLALLYGKDAELVDRAGGGARDAAQAALRAQVAGTDHRGIKKAIEQLNNVSGTFAARRMDRAISGALAGRRIDEVAK